MPVSIIISVAGYSWSVDPRESYLPSTVRTQYPRSHFRYCRGSLRTCAFSSCLSVTSISVSFSKRFTVGAWKDLFKRHEVVIEFNLCLATFICPSFICHQNFALLISNHWEEGDLLRPETLSLERNEVLVFQIRSENWRHATAKYFLEN